MSILALYVYVHVFICDALMGEDTGFVGASRTCCSPLRSPPLSLSLPPSLCLSLCLSLSLCVCVCVCVCLCVCVYLIVLSGVCIYRSV